MKSSVFLLLISFAFCSCKNGDAKKSSATVVTDNARGETLTDKMFFFGSDFDVATGVVTADCDCCMTNILFYSDSNYLELDYCEKNCDYFRGRYLVNDSLLIMIPDKIKVAKTYNFLKEDSDRKDLPTYTYTVKENRLGATGLLRKRYQNMLLLTTPETIGQLDLHVSFKQKWQQIGEEGVLRKLGID